MRPATVALELQNTSRLRFNIAMDSYQLSGLRHHREGRAPFTEMISLCVTF